MKLRHKRPEQMLIHFDCQQFMLTDDRHPIIANRQLVLNVAIRLAQQSADAIAPYRVTDVPRRAQAQSIEIKLIADAVQNDRSLRHTDARRENRRPSDAGTHMPGFWESVAFGHTKTLTQTQCVSARTAKQA